MTYEITEVGKTALGLKKKLGRGKSTLICWHEMQLSWREL
ncbi:hypothetical protein Lepto7376_1282 [[Leptolyngbya] sp. PCC 7376]|nr:hypothetical protein Lepto7376_1282 [[Leptolyngbya] sp. PCC 7376]